MLDNLKIERGFWYLASPYSKYPDGLGEAARKISEIAGRLIEVDIPVYCPISHSHAIAKAAKMSPRDHTIWMPANQPFMEAAHGLIMVQMRRHKVSDGMAAEWDYFDGEGRPIFYLDPMVLGITP